MPQHLLEVGRVGADFNTVGIQALGQSADLMSLIENGLLGGGGCWDQVFAVVSGPKQLGATEGLLAGATRSRL